VVDFDLQPTLTGPLIRLRPLRSADFEPLYSVASDPLIWYQHPDKGRSTREGFARFFADALASRGALVAVDRADDSTIGCSRFHTYRSEHRDVIIGYTFFSRSHWGGTYNGEMKRLMLDHAFRFVESVRFLVAEQNLRSRRAVEKLGAVDVGSEEHRELGIVHRIYELKQLQHLQQRAESAGVAMRGAFHPEAGEFPTLPGSTHGTLVLLGFTGSLQWPIFARSPEAIDGLPHPLDRWSRRVIGALAREFRACDIYPADSPIVPFQQLAMRCESVYPSPIGLLVHPLWGLWHSYRGGLIFPTRLPLPARPCSTRPCDSCEAKPCLSACPVGAFGRDGFDLKACLRHVSSTEGSDCRECGCRARCACPIGPRPGYAPEQVRFHMDAFRTAFQSGDREKAD
jgi:RimJ/RimL family protein N-acetyltransferase